ncbi:MAG: tyrosine-type recombinase/integrase [Candidatus Poribacteria bacterium]|nr:tyrosine-type recombinase/integrase [Candidatus Poribacteria bacterium]
MKRPLTFAKIKSLTKPGSYGDGGTLYLRIAPGGSKQWVQRLVIRGRRHDLGLGGWPLVSLQEAREAAFENRKQARRGEDLLATRQREAAPTFEEALEKVIKLHRPTWKDGGRTADSWRACLKQYAIPRIGRRQVSEITAADVLDIVGNIWTDRHETAKKVKRRLGAVLAWAVTQGYRSDNPVQAITATLPKADNLKGHFKAIPHEEVGTAIETVRASQANPSTIRCFEFLILTATRSSEARLMTWDEVDLRKRTWVIPAARTKTGKEHRVPLSSRACEILREAQTSRESALVFPSARGKALCDATISKLVRENGINGVPHAIARACFRSWCADVNVSREVAEACLAHVVKGVEASYQRSDLFERRRLVMQKWSDYVTGAPSAEVIPLHG